MSVQAIRWAAEQSAGGPMPKLVLYALADHCDSVGRCHPSLSTLAKETEASTSTVKRALATLVEGGLIVRAARTRGTGATTSTGYTLALSDPAQGSQGATPDQFTQSPPTAHTEPGASSQRATPWPTVSPHAWPSVSHQGEPPLEPTTEPKSRHARTRGTTTPAELAETATRPDAFRLVSAWREQTGAAYRLATVRSLARYADIVLREGGDPAAVRAALDEWDRRPDARPGLLPHLYDDAVKAARLGKQPPTSRPAPRNRGDKVRGWLALATEQAEPGEQRAVDEGRR